MLDGFIIERIRKEREQRERESGYQPLRIERSPPPRERPGSDSTRDRPEDREGPRGSVNIDFTL